MMLRPFAILMIAVPGGVAAQVDQPGGAPVERALLSEIDTNSELLRGAIRRIASNPRDADAFVDAGNAALALDDPRAALNFFTRADRLRPNVGRIKLGLASAHLRTENPFDALRLFDEAVKLGIAERTVAADRGLAFDLLGNFSRAQQDYALAGGVDGSDSLAVKRAVSLSLSGKPGEADALLIPLLRRNVREAWRARAFILAARGEYDEAIRVTQGFMDSRSASKFGPFLRRMPDLTGAQQAAAIHFGHFPARGVGRDSAAVRSIASANIPAKGGGAGGRLIPSGRPLGTPAEPPAARAPASNVQAASDYTVVAAAVPTPVPPVPPAPVPAPPAPVPAPRVQQISEQGLTAANDPNRAPIQVAASAPGAQGAQGAGGALPTVGTLPTESTLPAADVDGGQKIAANEPIFPPPAVAAAAPTIAEARAGGPASLLPPVAAPPSAKPLAAAPPADPPTFNLDAIVSAIEVPESEKKQTVIPVDLKAIKSAETKAPQVQIAPQKTEKKETPVEKYPARYWVQIGTGQKSAFRADIRRLSAKYPVAFKSVQIWSSPWGRTDRLVAGPFADAKAARKWDADFRKAGGEGFVWQSGDGTVVEKVK